jgi:hypothetical protein
VPRPRSVALAVLLALIAASFSQSFAAQQHPAPGPQVPANKPAPAAPNPAQKPHHAGATGTSDTAKFSCSNGPIELQFLSPGDSQELAILLNTIFSDVKVVPGATPGTGTDKTAKPDGTLCVEDRTTQKAAQKCDRTKKLESTDATFCQVQQVVTQLDIEAFKDGKLNSNYIVHLPNLDRVLLPATDGPSNQPVTVAESLAEYFSHATANLDIREAANGYFLQLRSLGGPEQAAASGENLSSEAGLVKRDLEQLDQLYRDAVADKTLRTVLINDTRSDCPANSPTGCQKVQIEAEQWLARHTIRLSILKPRDAALALQDLPGWTFQVRSYGQALTILPAELSSPRSNGAYLAADAVERDLLYHQKLDEDQSSSAPKSADTTEKSSTSAPPTTTTQSTTTMEALSGGKSTAPTLTTKVTTTAGPAPNPPASSASPDSKKSQDSATNGSGASTDTADADPKKAENASATNAKKGGKSGAAPAPGAKKPGAPTQTAGKNSNPPAKDASTWPTSLGQQPTLHLDNVVRLYHLRQADKIAEAINKVSSEDAPLVEPLDDNGNNDLLLILPTPVGMRDHSTDVRRAVAMLDLPRPQLSLQVWSYQISEAVKKQDPRHRAKASQNVQQTFGDIRQAVNDGNLKMTEALEHGLGTLFDAAQSAPNGSFFSPAFYSYLTARYDQCLRQDRYCLGYVDALTVPRDNGGAANASLSRLLLFLIAANDAEALQLAPTDTRARTRNALVDHMDDPACPVDDPGDAASINADSAPPLCFWRFRERLSEIAKPRNLRILRAALLEFLFEYKWTIVYPNDFIPYNLQRTAHVVDGLFAPVTDAFNQDLDSYVIRQLNYVEHLQKSRATGLSAFGSVQVSAISGTKASVEGKVDNYFDITPPQSLNDILNVGNQQNLASNLKTVLEPKEILMVQALANIGTQPRITAQVAKETKLTITPTTLDTASSAELQLDFDVSEPDPPATVNQKTADKDLLDRVAEYHVTNHVRVDALKLFQVSAFTMELTHPDRGVPVPIVGQVWEGVFGTTPGIGRLFRMPPYSKTEDNRSVAIVRAVVVPTAMDLGLSLPFAADRVEDPVTDTTDPLNATAQSGGRLREFHNRMVTCMLQGSDNCANLKLSTTPEDLRDPTTP